MRLGFALDVRGGASLRRFVASERVDEFSCVIVGQNGRVAGDEEVTVLVLNNDTNLRPSVRVHVFCVLGGRQSTDLEVQGRLFVSVGDGLCVRRFAVIHIAESAPDADHGTWQKFFADEPARDVDLVNALVAQVPVPVVPDPVPVVVELFAEDIDFWGGSAPEVKIEAFGDRLWSGDLFDRATWLVAGPSGVFQFSQGIAFEPFDGGFEPSGRTALGAALDDSIVFECRCCKLASFPNRVGHGFFHVHIFSSLRGPNCGERVPVIGCGNHHRIDVLAFEKPTDVAVRGDGLACVVGILLKNLFTVRRALGVDVAKRHEARVFCVESILEDARPASADPDTCDSDGIVGALGSEEGGGSEECRGGGCGDVSEESPAVIHKGGGGVERLLLGVGASVSECFVEVADGGFGHLSLVEDDAV